MNTTPRPELEAMSEEALADELVSLADAMELSISKEIGLGERVVLKEALCMREAARRLLARRWRPCEGDGSDIPRDVNSCLVATDSGSVGEAARVTDDDQDEWWWAGTQGEYYSDPIRFTANLKAWQPLPPPPAGKREEET